MNHLQYDVMLQEKRQDLLDEAARLRLVAEFERHQHRPRQRKLRVYAGELLIRLGQWLKGCQGPELNIRHG